MIYALTDGSPVIEHHHLEAAWSAWSYCRQSASWIFGNASGNPIVDRLWSALEGAGDSGLDRTQIHEVFGRNVHAAQINAAIQWLAERDRVRSEKVDSGGRKLEVIYSVDTNETNLTKEGVRSR